MRIYLNVEEVTQSCAKFKFNDKSFHAKNDSENRNGPSLFLRIFHNLFVLREQL